MLLFALTREQWINVSQIWWGVAAGLTKSTIILFYLRVFSPLPGTAYNITLKVSMVVVILFHLFLSLSRILQCQPQQKIWDPSVEGSCINLGTLFSVSGGFNVLFDLAILLMPIGSLWKLQMGWKRKIGVWLIFTIGTM